jgi:MFS transporter, PAT family, beta-lactamase induction signal transducer AmpG
MPAPTMSLRKKLLWISLFYFAQGMPFGIFLDVLPVYFRDHGVSLTDIGLMWYLTLPWTLKVLWAPLLDRYAERRTWVTICCSLMAVAMLGVPLLDAAHPSATLWLLLLSFTLLSATQDISIDAFSVALLSKGEEGVANGVRVALYRVALMVAGGGSMYLVAPFGWAWVFLALALAFVVLAIAAWAAPQVPVVHQPPRQWARQFWAFLSRRGSIAVFGFVLIYKIGDLVMGPMVKPFWIDRGMTPAEIGTISTNAGVILSVLGAMLGGLFTTRFGIFNGLWVLGLGQAVSNLGYAAVAHYNLPWQALYAASMFESFTQGLGTAAFLSFLMRICDKDQAATQYALLSALYALPRSLIAPSSGYLAQSWGYAPFFAFTFLLALPAYALLPWVRRWVGNGTPGGHAAADPAAETGADRADADAAPRTTSAAAR